VDNGDNSTEGPPSRALKTRSPALNGSALKSASEAWNEQTAQSTPPPDDRTLHAIQAAGGYQAMRSNAPSAQAMARAAFYMAYDSYMETSGNDAQTA
jgi:hypothetical protein